MAKTKKTGGNTKYIAAAVAAVVVLGIIIGFFAFSGEKECTDEECFISAANKCKESSFTQVGEESGITFTYYTNECVLAKAVVELGEGESQDMKNLLEGKFMTCEYSEGQFNKGWVNSLSLGIEDCNGELRDLLYQLLIFT